MEIAAFLLFSQYAPRFADFDEPWPACYEFSQGPARECAGWAVIAAGPVDPAASAKEP
jgi:hypothetical protein